MMKKLLFTMMALGCTFFGFSQTLYVPGGTGGVGSSTNGNVGIGVSDPTGKFTVKGSSLFRPTTGLADSWLPYYTGEIYLTGDKENSLSDGTIHLRTWSVTEGYVNRMVVKGDGKVGVGTDGPQANLNVKGDAVLFESSAGTAHSWVPYYDGGIYLSANKDVGNGADIHLRTWSTAEGYIDRMIVKGNGNVGIGTTAPGSYKLAVEGKIGAREVKVTLDSWADYVFKKDYKLRNLNEVEQFIKENNHLPEIPSEKEVLENGVELGAMQAKLLQKIEELTLYTIEQQKLIGDQNKRIVELEKAVKSNK